MRKSDCKNADRMPNKGQQVSAIAQENIELAVFLFHHWWRCICDWKVTEMHEHTVHLLAGQKRPKNKYKDPNVLPKVNKTNMTGTMESFRRVPQSMS